MTNHKNDEIKCCPFCKSENIRKLDIDAKRFKNAKSTFRCEDCKSDFVLYKYLMQFRGV